MPILKKNFGSAIVHGHRVMHYAVEGSPSIPGKSHKRSDLQGIYSYLQQKMGRELGGASKSVYFLVVLCFPLRDVFAEDIEKKG